ncbi:hypothetical protein POM88_042437 [Heracleum sosnowskyi]|uniref:Uncharacterized protein n=1 Tax=Heracleum sosnowskyi TaxID=360622 RepID=A0AAD8HGT1_9APIA|nr:hypothetical protein POM88_042437 [Heracleum sosnowskyi]
MSSSDFPPSMNDNNKFEWFWLIKDHHEPASLCGIFEKEETTHLMSQMNSNKMVQFDILHEVNLFNRKGDSRTSHSQSSTISVGELKENLPTRTLALMKSMCIVMVIC